MFQEEEELCRNFRESEQAVKTLTGQISERTFKKNAAQEKTEEASKLEVTLADKKGLLAELQDNQNVAKRQLDEVKTKLKDKKSKIKKELEVVDVEQKKVEGEIKCMQEEQLEQLSVKSALSLEQERILFEYDSAGQKLGYIKTKRKNIKKEKIKLLNAVDLIEKTAGEARSMHNKETEVSLLMFKFVFILS